MDGKKNEEKEVRSYYKITKPILDNDKYFN
jgi:hypothetical protein